MFYVLVQRLSCTAQSFQNAHISLQPRTKTKNAASDQVSFGILYFECRNK
jgi:hypothetical protein